MYKINHITYENDFYYDVFVPKEYSSPITNLFSYFSVDTLRNIYYNLLRTHFFECRQLSSMASVAKVVMDTVDSSFNDVTIPNTLTNGNKNFKELLSTVVRATIELQNELRVMYLPTAQRCHYIFTMTDLTMLFR